MSRADQIIIQPYFAPLLEGIGFDAPFVFDSPGVVVWRKLADRENCTLDSAWPDGRPARLHIKRYPRQSAAFAQAEATALEELQKRQIPSAPLVAWGRLADGRAFLVTEDLSGHQPADKLIAAGEPFANLLAPTAELAAKLHAAGLHHRDLYLCHFLVRGQSVKLIDAARVRPLPAWPLRRRWIVKDLAQFWYSMTQLPIAAADRLGWLTHYARAAGAGLTDSLRRAIESKSLRIAAHDANLNRREPRRHVSMPDTS